MKCVILAGGRGTRISELTKNIPKPMIKKVNLIHALTERLSWVTT